MPSERFQRQIDRLLDEAEQAIAASEWGLVRARCEQVLRLDPDNADARAYLAAAGRGPPAVSPARPTSSAPAALPRPTSPPSAPDGERRQLTVLFCDLVSYTPLSARLDPEELRQVVRAYQQVCAAVVNRYDGHIAQYLGDGLLVYFGYPQAHEDDAYRAVRAALAMAEAARALTPPEVAGESLAVRLGIHTGLVVVGEVGDSAHHEQLALGETPNVAARLQGLAEPHSVVISAATHRLVAGFFHCRSLGPQPLKGLAQPLAVYQVEGETGAVHRLDAAPALTPLVGREEEVALLRERWRQARTGGLQVVVLSGEAGIGKSRLVRVLRERLAKEDYTRIELRGAPVQQHSALAPLAEQLQRVLGFTAEDTPLAKVAKLEAALDEVGLARAPHVPVVAALLGLSLLERYPPLTLTPERLKQQTYATALAWLEAEAARRPVLFVVEDLHWIDPSTLELLSLLVERPSRAPLLAVFTCRPEFTPPWPPEAYLHLLTLSRLGRDEAAACARAVAGGKALPAEVTRQITARTDGVPLFVEELTKMVLESGLVAEQDGRYVMTGPLPPLAIPATLHDSLMARLDRLAPMKEVAQLGAALGREFGYELLAAVAGLDEAHLQAALEQLVAAGLVYQRGVQPTARYVFKHALVQDAAYASLLRSRRQQLHQRIARALLERFPDVVETQPEVLAHHYTEAGLGEQAIPYWQRAAERATARAANAEAVAHLERGLALVDSLPEGPDRDQRELGLRVVLGPCLFALKGHAAPEVADTYARAHELCECLGDTPALVPVLWGLYVYENVWGRQRAARPLAEQCLRSALASGDPSLTVTGHWVLGLAQAYMGEFAAAGAHFEQMVDLFDPVRDAALIVTLGLDSGTVGGLWLAWVRWYLGYPDQAMATMERAVARARALNHVYSLGFALIFDAGLRGLRGEHQRAREIAEEGIALCAANDLALFLGAGRVMEAWALTELRRVEEGIERLREAISLWHSLGARLFDPQFSALLAGALLRAGRAAEAQESLDEAVRVIEASGETIFQAEVYRLRGDVLFATDAAAAERDYLRAIEIARAQEAKSWELRATTSLARLWQQQGRTDEARRILADSYGWFIEGFDTRDLQEAKALLEQLA
jgi:class 3 adenylate cyclase/predicted ATPase